MSNVKTAISIQDGLFKKVDATARQMGVPRSQVFVMAVQEFLERRANRQMLEKINAAYEDDSQTEERGHADRMKQVHRQVVEDQW